MSDGLPYRPCVGVALVNRAGEAFIGHRKPKPSDEALDRRSWQMPQGGIDHGEAPLDAARRELFEETNVRSIEFIAELPGWLSYDLPQAARGRWNGRYRGQTQKWFLFRFVGEEKEIDVRRPAGGGHDAEFDAWRWERFERLPDLVAPFKRDVYEAVSAAFAPLARPAPADSCPTLIRPTRRPPSPVNGRRTAHPLPFTAEGRGEGQPPLLMDASASANSSSIFRRRR